MIPSFGGYSADEGGTEIADSCSSVSKIAQAYESVVTTYGVTRLDMDVEAKSQDNKAGIARRSAAIALLQRWAARHHRQVQIDFTLGVEPSGLASDCLHVLAQRAGRGRQDHDGQHHGLRLLQLPARLGHGHRGHRRP